MRAISAVSGISSLSLRLFVSVLQKIRIIVSSFEYDKKFGTLKIEIASATL